MVLVFGIESMETKKQERPSKKYLFTTAAQYLENIARLTEDVISGFQFTGIVPLNHNVVLDKISNKETEEEKTKRLLSPMISVLQNARFGEKPKVERRKIIRTSPGQVVRLEDFQDSAAVENDSINADVDSDAETGNISSTADSSSSEDDSADSSDDDSSDHYESMSLDDVNATIDEDGVGC